MSRPRRTTAVLTTLALGLAGIGAAFPAAAQPAGAPRAGAPHEFTADATTAQAPPTAEAARKATKPRKATKKRKAKGLRVVVRAGKGMKRFRKKFKVTVTGPRQHGKKFRKVTRRTRTWKNVRPGVYRIRAATFRAYEQRVVPTVSVTKVRIPRNRARRVARVTYTEVTFCSGPGYRLQAWGDNTHGQLGVATPRQSAVPVRNTWIGGLTAVTGSRGSTYALCNDGSVWTWGLNSSYQLGVGDTKNRRHPVRVPGTGRVVALAAGLDTGYALAADGAVYAWGQGRYGELGNGRSGYGTTATRPVRVLLPAPVTQIAAGGHSAYALAEDGTVYAWGSGGVGQRGNGTTGESTPRPVRVSGLTDVVELAAGHVTAYARTADGTMYGWGGSNQGEIPLVAPSTSTPSVIATGTTRIGASRSAGFFVTSTLHGFGSGRHHDTGRDTGGSPTTPDQVPGPSGPFTSIRQLVGAGHTSYLLDDRGYIYSWGANDRGQAGVRPRTGPGSTQGVLPVLMRSAEWNPPAVTLGAGPANGYFLYNPSDITR